MTVSDRLRNLIDASAPLWAGEAEIVGSYFRSAARSRESDRRWLAYQCYKEFWAFGVSDETLGLFAGSLNQLADWLPQIDAGVDRHVVLDVLEMLHEEFAHYCAFADVYDALAAPGEAKLDPRRLTDWPAEKALAAMRYEHQRAHGELGMRACRFTEGGYCALYAEGRKLAGNGGTDELIASACALVYEDEFGHMLKGILGLDALDLGDAEWTAMQDMAVAQLRQRIAMRNAQFGEPVAPARVAELVAGKAAPVAFDYQRAGLAA